jgi:hypothetical protein
MRTDYLSPKPDMRQVLTGYAVDRSAVAHCRLMTTAYAADIKSGCCELGPANARHFELAGESAIRT